MQHWNHPLLQLAPEVDEHVAAAHEIDTRERRILENVMSREYARVANRLRDPISALELHEETAQTLTTHVRHRALQIHPRSRFIDTRGVQIGPKYLKGDVQTRRFGKLRESHGEGIRLLTGRATQRPYANRLVAGTVARERGENIFFQRIESFR